MDLNRGFQIEHPSLLVPWGITEDELIKMVSPQASLRRVTDGYYVIQCTSLSGLRHKLGFHFEPRIEGQLLELEFFENSVGYGPESFALFQRHPEMTFGPPSDTRGGTEGFLSYSWHLEGADVLHFVRDHFGPEENVRIQRHKRQANSGGSPVLPLRGH